MASTGSKSPPELREFVVIGENIHATRIVRRSSPNVVAGEDGREAIRFVDAAGDTRSLPISEAERESANYQEGRIKHVRLAIWTAMSGDEPDASTALAYLEAIVAGQIGAGAHYLDLNVDEVSLDLSEQIAAMRWLVRTIEPWTTAPLAIDSPHPALIEAGLDEACGRDVGPADAQLGLARAHRGPRPRGAVRRARRRHGRRRVRDPGRTPTAGSRTPAASSSSRSPAASRSSGSTSTRSSFPISVDSASGEHCLAAFRRLRERFGPELHLTGGMSNVSFGLPNRRLVNDAFLLLAIEAGADSGILDPLASRLERVLATDRDTRPFQLAADVLTGADPNCRTYLKAYRAGELEL